MVDLSIVIVSWNVADVLSACLESIQTKRSHEIIVVDSASSDDSVQRIRQGYPHVKLLAQAENVGFTRGNNIGLATAQGRYLLLLNPDTLVLNGALDQMLDYMESHPQVGIIGPHTLNTDGTTQSSKRRFPTLITGFFESTWLQPYAPKAMMRRFYAEDVPDDAIAEVDWVQGSALLARREVYEQIGGLDEGYVMFSEEVDWCKRAKAAGWRVVYDGKAQIVHHGGKSTEQASARKHIHFQESKLRYYRKYHGALAAGMLRVFLLASYVVQIGFEGAKGLIGHKRALRLERVRIYQEVLRSGLSGAMQDTKAQRRKEFQS
jgi:N-acetylglucosaminyl-diphospho-decaprenol L-rhamnosyltransferase